MSPIDWKRLVRICEGEGCLLDREKGDHYIMTKPGLARPVVIPKKSDLSEDIVLSIGRTLGLNRKAIEERLNPRTQEIQGTTAIVDKLGVQQPAVDETLEPRSTNHRPVVGGGGVAGAQVDAGRPAGIRVAFATKSIYCGAVRKY